jgi:hypothetical protein
MTLPDLLQLAGKEYVCWFVPVGALKLRDGPVLVAKSTEQVGPDFTQVAAVVLVYQDKPWSMSLGEDSHWSTPNGSNALGQPFQPALTPVCAAVEDADGHALTGEARVPGAGEVLRLGIQEVLLAELLEVGSAQRRGLVVGNVVGLDLRERGLLLGGGRCLVQLGVRIGQRLTGFGQVDRLDRDDPRYRGQLGQGLDRDRPEHEAGVARLRHLGVVEDLLGLGGVALDGREHGHLGGVALLDLRLELGIQLGEYGVRCRRHLQFARSLCRPLARRRTLSAGRLHRRRQGRQNQAGQGNERSNVLQTSSHTFSPPNWSGSPEPTAGSTNGE